MVCAFTNLGGGGALVVEFDAEFKFAKIQNFHVEGGWVGWGGLVEFDAEFKFAKIQNSHVEGGWGRFVEFDAEFKFAKIQNSHVEGGGLVEFDAEFKFAKKKKFSQKKFSDKNWNGFVLDFEYRVVPLYEV